MGRGPEAFIYSLSRPLKMVCVAWCQGYGKGPVSGVRDFRLHDPRQVTPLEPQFQHL